VDFHGLSADSRHLYAHRIVMVFMSQTASGGHYA
jgi:hypothetical protein